MKLQRIFTKKSGNKLWAVCYPEDKKGFKDVDIFRKLMNLWNDTEYLTNYFIEPENQSKLADPFWEGISIDEAIDMVLEQSNSLEVELYAVSSRLPGYENTSLSDIFLPLHTNTYSLNFKNEKHRKAKPKAFFEKPIIRLYGVELEDGAIIISGGAIKLTKPMEGDIFELEKERLKKVQEYLKSEGISDQTGLE